MILCNVLPIFNIFFYFFSEHSTLYTKKAQKVKTYMRISCAAQPFGWIGMRPNVNIRVQYQLQWLKKNNDWYPEINELTSWQCLPMLYNFNWVNIIPISS